jgi:murein DD-endopeptidase MepM/ murein hydrolase activator NlpD
VSARAALVVIALAAALQHGSVAHAAGGRSRRVSSPTPAAAAPTPPTSARPRRTPATPRPTPVASAADLETLAARLRPPITGLAPGAIGDTFADARGGHRHEATDIVAPRGTPVVAVDDGVIARLFTSVPGGLTVYELSADGAWTYYYAHLDHYPEGLREGALVRAGDVLGYVGNTGNAGPTAHLHFAILRRDAQSSWWEGTAVDPYPLLRAAHAR